MNAADPNVFIFKIGWRPLRLYSPLGNPRSAGCLVLLDSHTYVHAKVQTDRQTDGRTESDVIHDIDCRYNYQWHAPPPWGPNSFNFMQFSGKYGKIVCWRPPSPGQLAPPLRGNPGSTTDYCYTSDSKPRNRSFIKYKEGSRPLFNKAVIPFRCSPTSFLPPEVE